MFFTDGNMIKNFLHCVFILHELHAGLSIIRSKPFVITYTTHFYAAFHLRIVVKI